MAWTLIPFVTVYLPVIRAYRVGPELVAWTDGKNLRELGIYRQTGCYIERIRRNGIVQMQRSCRATNGQ
ncbi:hypothetical protein ACNKHV_04945 [Shigella flexneri]